MELHTLPLRRASEGTEEVLPTSWYEAPDAVSNSETRQSLPA